MNQALNVVRAVAAALVCIGHVRGHLLLPLEATGGGVATNLAYALTGIGHGAVLVFFVLSGYFVGGSVIKQRREGTFVWGEYLVARSVRLGVVLVPALVLTLVADRVGMAVFGDSHNYLPGSNAVDHGGALDLLGNAAFLQAWIVPPFGSNVALWSLAYEWAYYLIFPLLAVAGSVGFSV